jgi:DNA-binding CsgD family transcriptional regulator
LDDERVMDVLAAIYQTDGGYDAWRSALMASIVRLHPGARTCTWFEYDWHFDSTGLSLDAIRAGAVMGEDAALDTWLDARQKVPPPLRALLFGRTGAGTASQMSGLGEKTRLSPAWSELWRPPVIDSFGLVAADPAGRGVCASTGLPEVRSFSKRELRLLHRLASHLSAGHRLRRAGRSSPLDEAEAVLTPNGRLLHAGRAAKDKRVELDEGRRRRDEAKKTKEDADKALEIWQGLVAGRWSLVDHFDTDGRRFLLAMKNTSNVDQRADLTARERRVCALAAMGHRDKEISYMLGLTLSSVTAALHRARVKLKVRTRAELALRWRQGSG